MNVNKEGDIWVIGESDYTDGSAPARGNRYLCANGYMGIRGTLEEHGKEQLAAINLAGIYDRAGDGWREPLNTPNPLYTILLVNEKQFFLPERKPMEHRQELDFRHGIMRRSTVFGLQNDTVEIRSERFAHAVKPHLICMRYEVRPSRSMKVTIKTGIDCDIWELNGPHYRKFVMAEDPDGQISVRATTVEQGDQVVVAERCFAALPASQGLEKTPHRILRIIEAEANSETPLVIEKIASIYTSNDTPSPLEEAKIDLDNAVAMGYDALFESHCQEWEHRWEISQVNIDGDNRAFRAINYSLYHLMSIAPRHATSLSIPARGLSGQTYKGAIFWDTEMFMLDFFINCDPQIARSIMKYRIDTLDGARAKARQYGYEGAFYAWESQERGFDACSDYNVTDVFTGRPMRTYFRDKQIHISGDVVYGLMKYVDATGDKELLYDGGAEMAIECARFYDSCLVRRVHSDVYELWDVIGPDEYHERVNNNGYTNRIAKYTLDVAAELLKLSISDEKLAGVLAGKYELDLYARFKEDAARLKLPASDEKGVREQFDGYFTLENVTANEIRSRLLCEREYWGGANGIAANTQVIKQADVVAWLVMFPEDFGINEKRNNWSYYEPRTEHGSSLSACMYSLLACECGDASWAYPLFLKSAEADLKGGGKEWAGDIYIGGTHPAAAGGAYMTVTRGFAGIKGCGDGIAVTRCLPDGWRKLNFRMYRRGKLFEVNMTPERSEVREIPMER